MFMYTTGRICPAIPSCGKQPVTPHRTMYNVMCIKLGTHFNNFDLFILDITQHVS